MKRQSYTPAGSQRALGKGATMRNIFRSKLAISISLAALLLVNGIGVTMAASGKVGVGNKAPDVLSYTLYENDHVTTTSTLAPMTSYWIDVVGKDTNKETDLDQVNIKLYYDADNAAAGTDPVSGDETTAVIISWSKGAGWGSSTPTVDDGTGSWSVVGQSYTPNSGVQGTWAINFTAGKVSMETNGTDDWDVYIVALDEAAATSAAFTGFGNAMGWYGEVSNEVTTEFDFGTILPGDVDQPINLVNGATKAFFDSYPVANGNYQVQVKSSATWGTLNFGTDITALKVDDDNVIDGDTLSVTTTYQTIPGHLSDVGPTTESGDTVPLYGWVSLAAEGLEIGSHTGTLYLSILAD